MNKPQSLDELLAQAEDVGDAVEVMTRILLEMRRPQKAPVVNVEVEPQNQPAPVVHVSSPPVSIPPAHVNFTPLRPYGCHVVLNRNRMGEIESFDLTFKYP